jgi:cold shock CspA family protein
MSTGTVQRFDDAIGFGVIVDAVARVNRRD